MCVSGLASWVIEKRSQSSSGRSRLYCQKGGGTQTQRVEEGCVHLMYSNQSVNKMLIIANVGFFVEASI
jgi:hypothetical protein